MRLARHVTLPMDDAVSFKDPLDRRMDADIKRAYTAAGNTCRPVLALTSLAKAISAWAEKIEADLQSGADTTAALKLLSNIKHSGDFVGEAAINSLRCSARAMKSSVMAQAIGRRISHQRLIGVVSHSTELPCFEIRWKQQSQKSRGANQVCSHKT